MNAVMYARVSRDDLNCENQKQIMVEYCKRMEITNPQYFYEEISSRKTRPIKEQLINNFRSGYFDTIIVVRIDRFARSITELIMNIQEIVEGGGRFIAIQNGIDFQKGTYNASQQLMLNIYASFAQFEREIIRERTLEGLARVKAQGKKLGRPFKDGSKNQTNYVLPDKEKVVELYRNGKTYREIAEELRTSKNRVFYIIKNTPHAKRTQIQVEKERVSQSSVGDKEVEGHEVS